MPMHSHFYLPRLTRSAALAALALGLWATAWVPAAHALDLRQAYEAAVANDASIKAARAATQASHERLPQAQAQRLPNLSFSGSYNRNHLESTTPNILGQNATSVRSYNSHNLALVLRQPLYRPGVTAAIDQAQAQVDNADAVLQGEEQELLMRVGQAYFEALQADAQLALVLTQKTVYATQVDAARQRWEAGHGVRTDVDEAQAQLDMALAQELEARQSQDFYRHRLQTMTGLPANALAALAPGAFAPALPQPDSVDAWMSRAELASPQLHALHAQLRAAQAEVDKARAGHRPTLDAVAQWSRSESDSVTSVNSRYENKFIGVQLNVPLYAGGAVSAGVREALAAQERVQQQLEATRLDLALRVRTEFRNMTEGVLRIRALEQAVRSAEQMVHSNRESFRAGVRTSLDVLSAEQQKMTALRDLAQARHGYALARLRLHALADEDRLANVQAVNAWLVEAKAASATPHTHTHTTPGSIRPSQPGAQSEYQP